ncbi:MAG: heavy metal translocating P-type ATPase [Armatimonadota bacterium]|nr:heavy metal translocating P-type ATPase [Armatimonadota bacterium]MDR7519078.1 heavy metal translocating P-type ATPase [Armatimonadota bacterium]MDR7550233.1 heavy metal translocating P-type ATPase [Armatimonadota bacterium]
MTPKPAYLPAWPRWVVRHAQALLTAATLAALLVAAVLDRLGLPAPARAGYLLAYLFGGAVASRSAARALRAGRIDVNLLMLLSAAGAAVLGAWDEGAVLLFLFSLSNTLESHAMARTRRAIEALMALRPDRALVRRSEGEVLVDVDRVAVGETIVVRPGERIPLDGRVVAGTSDVDQAPITGESIPVARGPGEEVFAGTINGGGLLEIEVTRPAAESTLVRIIRLVAEAQRQRAPTQRLIERFGQPYALAVIIASALLVFALSVFGGWSLEAAFYRAMALLVVASPCALVISTPASLLSAIANAARAGVLFKGGAALEALAGVRAVVFDKTGTLTRGVLAVTDVVAFDGADAADVLALAAAAEQRSEHHLASAIVTEARRRRQVLRLPDAFQATPGLGVVASLDGTEVAVGSPGLIARTCGGVSPPAREALARYEAEGKTAVLVAAAGRVLGAIAMADAIRPEAAAAVAALRRLGIDHIGIVTGDNDRVARGVASALGITLVEARLLPEGKVEAIRRLRDAGRRVAMVGDGVNDAPAMASATVGVAMGRAGTDAALETADVVLMRDDLSRLIYALALARRAQAAVIQNLVFASLVIVGLVVAVLVFGLPLAYGVVGHEMSTVIVVANGLRLLGYRPRGAVALVGADTSAAGASDAEEKPLGAWK